MFFPLLKMTFDIFYIHLKPLKIKSLMVTSSFTSLFVFVGISKMSKLKFSSTCWSTLTFSNKGCKWWLHLNNIGYKVFLSCSWTMALHCSRPINEDIKHKFLNLGLKFKDNMLWIFFSSYFLKKLKLKIKTFNLFFSC